MNAQSRLSLPPHLGIGTNVLGTTPGCSLPCRMRAPRPLVKQELPWPAHNQILTRSSLRQACSICWEATTVLESSISSSIFLTVQPQRAVRTQA